MQPRHTLLTSVVLGALLVGATVTPAAGAQTEAPPEPSMTIDLAADGDARVTLVSTYDLEAESEQAAFDELRTNETARNELRDRYTDNWSAVASNTERRTDREMTVRNSSLALSRTNSTGVATFSLTWTGLAAAEEGMLTLDEPFASEFRLDRQFVVAFPESYTLDSVSPGPSNVTDGRLVYHAGADLDGLSIVAIAPSTASATPMESPTGSPVSTSGGSGPGFGVVGALVALLGAALLAHRRA
jgi:PGF-CTERM protein